MIATGSSADDELGYKELKHQIDQALELLPNRCREVFRLSRYEQLSNKEIAERLQISVRTVETQISIALKSLRNVLSAVMLVYLYKGGL